MNKYALLYTWYRLKAILHFYAWHVHQWLVYFHKRAERRAAIDALQADWLKQMEGK